MKNKKLNMLIILGAFMIGMIFAYFDSSETKVYAKDNKKNKANLECIGYCGNNITELKDKKTGVHYFLYEGYYEGSMVIRYNADGSVFAD